MYVMRGAFQKLLESGCAAFSLPEIFQKMALYQIVGDIIPRNTIVDRRSGEQLLNDIQGVEENSLTVKLNPYTEKPTIINSTHMGDITKPSLHHSEKLELIVFLH